MSSDLLARIDAALQSDEKSNLLHEVSSVEDWQAISDGTANRILRLIGMYGFSGRTDRYREIVMQIVDSGVNVDVFTAAMLKLNEVAKGLLTADRKLIVATNEDGDTALHCCAERGNYELAAWLCAQGADVNALNHGGETPIQHATHAGPWKQAPADDVVELLCSNGAEIDFHTLATLDDHQAIQKLIDTSVQEVDALDQSGRTALYHAAHNGHVESVATLLRAGADPNLRCEDGQTALSTACLHMLSQECDLAIVEDLIEHGASPSLESAIVREDLELIEHLVEGDRSVLQGQDHTSALGYAIHVWRPKSLRRLLELGAVPNETNWGHIERIAQATDRIEIVSELRRLVGPKS